MTRISLLSKRDDDDDDDDIHEKQLYLLDKTNEMELKEKCWQYESCILL